MFVAGFGVVSLSFLSMTAVSRASVRKRQAETWEEWSESVAEVRRCKRRRLAWLRSKEVAWRDDKAQQAQLRRTRGMLSGFLPLLRNCVFVVLLYHRVRLGQRRLRWRGTRGQNTLG